MRRAHRIGILTINYPPEPSGNAPYAGALAEGLARRGNDVHVLTAQPHYPAWRRHDGYDEWTRREDINGVHVARLKHYIPNPPRGVRRLLSEVTFGVRQLCSRRPRVDAYVALNPALFATWIASWRFGRTPFVVWVQDIYALGLAEIGEGGGTAAKVTRWVEQRLLRKADRVMVIHDRFKERLIELYGIEPNRIEVRRNWTYVLGEDITDRDAARQELGWGDETVVLYTGNFGAKQGLEHVIRAAEQARDADAPVRFVLLGGGGEADTLRALAGLEEGDERPGGKLGSHLAIMGPKPPAEFRRAIAAADALLVSEKLGVAESSVPSKMATYFAAGRPVIAACDADGITASEVAAAQAGIAVPAGDSSALLTAALELRDAPDRAAQMGDNGRAFHRAELEQERALDRWHDLVDELTRPRTSRDDSRSAA